MKAKKAAKGLKKAHSLLTAVAKKWTEIKPEARELLSTAESSLKRTLALIDAGKSAVLSSKGPARELRAVQASAKRLVRKGLTDEARKKMSIAAKKRWAAVKSRAAKSLAG